jgi:hypothetical protein
MVDSLCTPGGMPELVRLELAVGCAPILALVAGERALAGMSAQVHNEMPDLRESKVALFAGVRALARVSALVNDERAALGASIVALVAGESAHARVKTPVH